MALIGNDEGAAYDGSDDEALFMKHVAHGDGELLFVDSLLLDIFFGKDKEDSGHA